MLLRSALLLASLVFSSFASHSPYTEQEDAPSWPHLSVLLDTIDSTVLHGVLHQLAPKFQDGVFSKDRSAIEHVHSENPEVASKLVHIALKRQAANSTTSRDAASISSVLNSQIRASTVPGATTVLVAPDAPARATAIATVDGGVVYSTIGGGLVTLQSSAVEVSFTPSTESNVFVTTLPNGDVQTQTSVVVVNAPVTDEGGAAAGTAGAAATTGSPGLQDAATGLKVSAIFMVFAGMGGLAFML